MTENTKYTNQYPAQHQADIEEDEIDLVALALTVWHGRKAILITLGVAIVLGLFVALFSSEQFTTTVKLMPETGQSESSLGKLGSLASQFGFGGLNKPTETNGSIPPLYYPEIMKSLPVMKSLLEHEVYIPEAEEKMNLFYYFSEYRSGSIVGAVKKYTIGLPFTILGWLRGEKEETSYAGQDKNQNIVTFSKEEWEVIEQLRELISVEMNEENGIVTITATMPEDFLAADVAAHVTTKLTQYIKEYRTEKLSEDVAFIKSRKDEALNRFEEAQEKLARFRDESHGQLTAMARTQEQRLQSEYDLAFSVYNSLANRLEEARIELQEETPVVKILEPAAIPKERSAPKRSMIMVISAFLGVIAGIAIVFGRIELAKLKDRVKELENEKNEQ